MEIVISDKIQIWKKYNTLVNINLHERKNYFLSNHDLMNFRLAKFNPTKVRINGQIFDVVPATALLKASLTRDNKLRYLYLLINLATHEYYLGQATLHKAGEVKHYTTPELKLEGKHPACQGDFVKLFFAPCATSRELYSLYTNLVNTELLQDSLCLNGRKELEQIFSTEKNWKACQIQGPLRELDILGSFFDEKKTASPSQAPSRPAPTKTSAKTIQMMDSSTGLVLQSFASYKEAAAWLVQEGKAKSISCASSVSAVCRGVGNRKQAYGYKWSLTFK